MGQASDSLALAVRLFKQDSLGPTEAKRALGACLYAIQAFSKQKNLADWLKAQRTYATIVARHRKEPFHALELMEAAHLQAWKKPETEAEFLQKCYSYMWEARIANWVGDFIKVKSALQKANVIFEKNLNSADPAIAEFIFLEAGNANVRLGDYENARQMFEEGIRYSQKPDAAEVAKYNDYGSLYLTIDSFSEALAIYRRGLSAKGLPDAEIKLLYLNEAECLARMGNFQEALAANQKAADIVLEEDDERYNRCLYGLYENYGIVCAGMARNGNAEKFAESIEWYRKTLAAATSTRQRATNREIAGFQTSMADVLSDWEKYREALEMYHEALRTLLPELGAASEQNPSDSILFAEKFLYRALEGKARAFFALNTPEKALECYERIPVVEAKLLATHNYESSSLLALNESRKRFDHAVSIARQLYESSNYDPRFAERAFLLSEQARGVLLLQNLARAQTDFQLPPELRAIENDLSVKTAWYDLEIAKETSKGAAIDATRVAQLKQELFRIKQKQEEFQELLRDSFPNYLRLFKDIQFIGSNDVPALLRQGQTFISYYLNGNTAHIFSVVTGNPLRWQKVDLPADFRTATIQPFIEYLANGEGNGDAVSKVKDQWFKQKASELYKLLLSPALSPAAASADALVIVPDDVLAFLPFELLLSEPSQAGWPDLPFLLKKYSISYAYSATVLYRQQANMREHKASNRIPFAGFAPEYKSSDRDPQTGDGLYSISGMKEMADKVQKMLGGKVFHGDEANEPEFVKTAPSCRVLLLAMHGFVHEAEPTLSRLLFGNPQKNGTPDNVLYTNELQITYLPADLVVLNACYSGYGKLQRGEGVYSVTRALTSAGVPATLMSVWKLHGASSPVLIEAFFQKIMAGSPKDVALQQAKIEFLQNPEYDSMTHPSFWGGLLATGDMSALQF